MLQHTRTFYRIVYKQICGISLKEPYMGQASTYFCFTVCCAVLHYVYIYLQLAAIFCPHLDSLVPHSSGLATRLRDIFPKQKAHSSRCNDVKTQPHQAWLFLQLQTVMKEMKQPQTAGQRKSGGKAHGTVELYLNI